MGRRVARAAVAALALAACSPPLPADKVFEPPRPAPPGAKLAFSAVELAPNVGSCRSAEELTGWLTEAVTEELQRAGYNLKAREDSDTPQLAIRIDRLDVAPCGWVAAQFLATHARVTLTVTLCGQDNVPSYRRSLEGADDLPAGIHDAARLATGNATADALHFVTRDAAFTAAVAGFRKNSISP